MGGIRFRRRFSFWTPIFLGITVAAMGWSNSPPANDRIVSAGGASGMVEKEEAAVEAPLEGGFEFVDGKLVLRLDQVVFKMSLEPPYLGELNIDHGLWMGIPVVASVSFQGEESPLKGTFQAKHFLVNYLPAPLFQGEYELKEGKFFLSACRVGESYQADGNIELSAPYNVSLKIQLRESPATEVFFISHLAKSGALTGTAKGTWQLTGPVSGLAAEGTLEMTNGQLGKKNPILFSSLFFRVKGTLPLLSVTEARVNTDPGILLAKGDIDLRDMGKTNPLEKIKFYSDTKMMRWKGWDIQTADEAGGEGEVRVARNLSQDIKVSFRSFMNDEVQMAKANEGRLNEFELEYRFQKNQRVKMQVKGHEEFLGLENRVRF